MDSISPADIAVVSMACRYPGDANSPEGFYSLLRNGRAAWSKIPKERFDINQYHHPSQERQGNIAAQGGYFMKDDIATFDAPFFSMTAAEANAMDPQQRMLLESTYEALESGGIPTHKIAGSKTSVFVGCFTRDYESVSGHCVDNGLLYQGTGQGLSMLSNRISWFFDLKGPSMTLDTACSSSLLAVHLACQSIRSGDSKMSIVGGAGLIIIPDIMRAMTALHFLSPDSKCYSFDDRANGYARGEGVGTIILKPVVDAIRDGDTIRAVIRGTGSNQDGRTPGITLPSSEAQAQLIESTYRNAGLPYNDTHYFEAHGTGTPAGDPIELSAVGATFGRTAEKRSHSLLVGSVKTNIGHLEGCAGLAGLMKAILSLESGYIFPSLNFRRPNPRLRLAEWNLKIATELTPWPKPGVRRISVNSFGYGGSNAHAIIDDAYHYMADRGLHGHSNTAPAVPSVEPTSKEYADLQSDREELELDEEIGSSPAPENRHKQIFVLSAPDQAALGRLSSLYSEYVDRKGKSGNRSIFLKKLAHTLASRRSVFTWRQSVVGSSATEVSAALRLAVPTRSKQSPCLAMIFSGQGAQWFAMGRELMQHQIYADSITRADHYLKIEGAQWSVLEELAATEELSRVSDPEFSQPLCTVLQVALVDLLHHWGVDPSAVAGHSSGEIAAAYAAGALSDEDAWKIAFHRGQVTKRIAKVRPDLCGGMTAVGLSEEKVQAYIDTCQCDGTVVIACVNSPNSVTISGDSSKLRHLEAQLTKDAVFNRQLKVSNAYHSPHMECVVEEYRRLIREIKPRDLKPSCTFYSSVTGIPCDGPQLNANYWCDNLIRPVRFLDAIKEIASSSVVRNRKRRKNPIPDIYLELGPSGTLRNPLQEIAASQNRSNVTSMLSMLLRGKDAIETSLNMAGQLWALGYSQVNLEHANRTPSSCGSFCDTPTYPWNHSVRYWHEDAMSSNHRFPSAPRLDILGAPVRDWNRIEPKWRQRIKISELPWVKEHVVHDSILYPAAGYICAVIEAARQVADTRKTVKRFELRDITILRALQLEDNSEAVEMVTSFKPRKLGLKGKDAPWTEWTIYSNNIGGHTEHCSGLLYIHYEQNPSEIEGGREEQYRNLKLAERYRAAMAETIDELTPDDFYSVLDAIGMQYGPLFRNVSSIRKGKVGSACANITIPDTKSAMPAEFEYDHIIHPCTLDACFQSVFTAFFGMSGERVRAMVPTAIESIVISSRQLQGAGSTYHGFIEGAKRGFYGIISTLHMSDESWSEPLLEINGLACVALDLLTMSKTTDPLSDAVPRKLQSYWHWEMDPTVTDQSLIRDTISVPRIDSMVVQEKTLQLGHRLEQLTIIFGQRALKNLTKEVEDKLPPYLIKYLTWLRNYIHSARCDALPEQSDESPNEPNGSFIETKDDSIEVTLLSAVGRQLDGILNGTITALSVLMEEDMLANMYAESVWANSSNHTWEKCFNILGHKRPAMRILELGAGTGSITGPTLQGLSQHGGSTPRCTSYVYTDIHTGFFESAAKKFEKWSQIMTFKRLDIETDPIAQGFEAESFDVITAINVLHVTKNVNDTLQNVLKLLKPGGHLLISEITQPKGWSSMIYGTLPGWWLSEDGRSGGPLMSDQQWIDAFERNGLRSDFVVPDMPSQEAQLTSFLGATKMETLHTPFENVFIVDNGSPSSELQGLADCLRQALTTQGLQADCCSIANLKVHKKAAIISLLETEDPYLITLDESKLKATQEILLMASNVLWVTRGDRLGDSDPDFRLIDGLVRTVRMEDSNLRLHILDLQKSLALDSEDASKCVLTFFRSISSIDPAMAETEAAFVSGELRIPRLYDDEHKNQQIAMLHKARPIVLQNVKQAGRPMRVTIGTPGMLDTLHLVDDDDALRPLRDDHVEIEVKAASINFLDVMASMGMVVAESMLGCDGSGIIARVGSQVVDLKPGDRVVFAGGGTFRNTLKIHGILAQKMLDNMSFADAASLPIVYMTAYQGLINVGRLQPSDTILIHSAAGGLGQAAIQVAQYIGAKILVTVGSVAKKQLLIDAYGIPEEYIFNSRDLMFADAVKRVTNGEGVDMVLNSLAGEALRKTWTCLKPFGRFIEVGKRDILGNTGLEMMPFLRNIVFAGVNIEDMYNTSPTIAAELMKKVFGLIQAGHMKPVHPVTIYSVGEMEKAFRQMQQGKHMGKIVLSFEDGASQVPAVLHNSHPLQLRSDGTYLLVGGLGGIGRALAMWLASNGARYIALASRSGGGPAAKDLFRRLKAMGVSARAYACDVADHGALKSTLEAISSEMPKIHGVVQGAMVLADGIFANMKIGDWVKATRPKIAGSWNLHDLLPKDLDFFIMLSSIAGVHGSRGQSNYAAGNSYQQALAWHRHSLGLAATAIDLGAMGKFGFIAENINGLGLRKKVERLGSIVIQPDDLFSIMESAITGFTGPETRMPVQATIGEGTGGMIQAAMLRGPFEFYWHDDIKFSYLRHLDTNNAKVMITDSSNQAMATLAAATTLADAIELAQELLVAKLARAMMVSLEDIDVSRPASAYGVDSLAAVEVRNWISREMKSDLTVFDILSPIPLSQLVLKLVLESSLISREIKAKANVE